MADTQTPPPPAPALTDPTQWLASHGNGTAAAANADSSAAPPTDPTAWLASKGQSAQASAAPGSAADTLPDWSKEDNNSAPNPNKFPESRFYHPGTDLQTDALVGAGTGAVHTLLGAYHLIRQIPGVGEKLPAPSDFIESLGNAPDSLGGKIGHLDEQAAEYVIPEAKTAKAVDGANMLLRMLAHGLTTSGVAGVQSGGDTGAMLGAGALGAAGVPASDFLGFLGKTLIEKGLFRPNPVIGTTQAWKPTPSDAQFPDIAPSALSDVNKFGGGPKGKYNEEVLPRSLNPASKSDAAIDTMQDALEPWLERADEAGITASGDPLVEAAWRAMPPRMKREDPAAVREIMQRVMHAYGGQEFPVRVFRDYLRTGNASDSPFYARTAAAQGTSGIAGNPPAIDAAINDALREELYTKLDLEDAGAGPREIQSRTGSVINLRNAAERRRAAILGEKAVTTAQGIGRIATGGLAFKSPIKPLLSPPTSLLHPFEGPTDSLIKKLFESAPEATDLPLPKGDYPKITAQNRLLTRGDLVTPPPADTSGPQYNPRNNPMEPADNPGYGGAPTSQRRLPASNYPSYGSEGKGGVIVPDIIGSSSRGEGTPHRLIAAPAEGTITQYSREPLEREILAPGPATHGWLPNAPGQATPEPGAGGGGTVISKRGEAVPNTPQPIKQPVAKTLSDAKARDYVNRAGGDLNKARRMAVRDGYSLQ